MGLLKTGVTDAVEVIFFPHSLLHVLLHWSYRNKGKLSHFLCIHFSCNQGNNVTYTFFSPLMFGSLLCLHDESVWLDVEMIKVFIYFLYGDVKWWSKWIKPHICYAETCNYFINNKLKHHAFGFSHIEKGVYTSEMKLCSLWAQRFVSSCCHPMNRV